MSNPVLDKYNSHSAPHGGAGSSTKVGIFWSVGGGFVVDAVDLPAAEPYGDTLQHGGHFDYWQNLIPATVMERKFKSHAYDYYPRGRVVFFPKRQISRVYVDRCMGTDDINAVLNLFDLQRLGLEIEGDLHYRCAKCNSMFIDDPP